MPFENLETITKQNMPPMAKISYMPPQAKGKAAAKKSRDPQPQLMISIPTTLCGTAKAKTFMLQLGSGADSGKLRIKGNKTGGAGIEPKELKHAFIDGARAVRLKFCAVAFLASVEITSITRI